MNRRLAIALACSLALHALLVLSLRGDATSAQGNGWRRPLNVYLQPALPPGAADRQEVSGVSATPKPVTPNPVTRSNPLALLPMIKAEERYLLPGEVDVRAQPINMPVLVYPEKAQQMRIGGLVRLRVYLNESGKIDKVNVVAANPPGVFEESALSALLATSFTPAQKNGHAVKSQKLIEIKFDPYESINLP